LNRSGISAGQEESVEAAVIFDPLPQSS